MSTYRNPKTGEVLTEEQFQQRFKSKPLPAPPKVQQNLGTRTADIYKQSGQKIMESINRGSTKFEEAKKIDGGTFRGQAARTGALLESALGTTAGVARGVFAPIEATTAEAMKFTGIDKLLGQLGNTREAQAMYKWAEENPDIARNLSDALTVGGSALATKAGGGLLNADVSKLPSQALQYADDAASGLTKALAPKNPVGTAIPKNIDFARSITQPKLSTKEAEEAIKAGRLTEPGLFKKSQLTPTPRGNMVAESIADVVSPNKPVTRNIESIHREMSRINQAVYDMIADRKAPFNLKQLRTKLMESSDDSRLIFASDATAEKTYKAVVDEFLRNVDKKDTLGLFSARQSFDKIPAIRKLLQTEGLGENVKRQIVLDVRKAANEYISELLPPNSPYKALMMKESYMFEALENIAAQNASMLGRNNIQILLRKYPMLNWAIGAGVGGTVAGGISSL